MSEQRAATAAKAEDTYKRRRYGYVVLFFISILMAGASIGFTIHQDHYFCDLINGFTTTPVAKPADPKTHPAQEQQWLSYERLVKLGHNLGC